MWTKWARPQAEWVQGSAGRPNSLASRPGFEAVQLEPWLLMVVIKYIYLLPTYLHFIPDIEDRRLLLTSSTTFVNLPF
jgi:hypothetical protein